MENNVILGNDLMIFADGQSIACAKSCKITLNASSIEVSSKDSGKWTERISGKLSWNASSENLFVLTEYKDLFEKLVAREKVTLTFGYITNGNENGKPEGGWTMDATNTYTGSAIISSIDANASDGDIATYSINFEGTGALTVSKS